ncbi:MAG TPA: glycosyltransferase family 4 protein [Candidatus Binatia bacterium]|jgi:UDP-glucose:(heptosyl)LPS alpha-1,3-glucosyltransferase
MKIALAHKRLDNQGGTEVDFYRTASGLRDQGHEVHLFCAEFAIEPPAGTYAHRVPVAPMGRTARLWSFAKIAPKIIRPYTCDLVVSFGRMVRQDVLRSGGGSHRAFLEKFAAEGGLRRRLWQSLSPYHQSVLALERWQFQPGNYKRIIAVSAEVKRELLATYPIPEDKISVIYNGVDDKRFHLALRDEFRAPIRRQWHIPSDAPMVLFVGSGFRRKGLDRLLNAWRSPELKDTYLLVVGDDAKRARYQALAEERAKGKVIFVGRRHDVESYYGAADLLALPAVQEAFGNVVLEAAATGLPAVVSRAVGAAEILEGRLTEGIVSHPEDPREIASKMLSMLARSRDRHLSVEARQLAERYSWSRHFSRLEAFLKDTVVARN